MNASASKPTLGGLGERRTELHYQPIVDLASGRIGPRSAGPLAASEGGYVSPNIFCRSRSRPVTSTSSATLRSVRRAGPPRIGTRTLACP